MDDFSYLSENDVYLDSACQSLRPQPVIDALNEYYITHNSCGERVKYPWGVKTDAKVDATRKKVLKYLKLKNRDYFVSFTLNTTYALNLVLSQLDTRDFKQIITSDIEHNSPFLSSMSLAERSGLPRKIISRNEDGSLPLDDSFDRAIVIVNTTSNIDGRQLINLKDVVKKVHKSKGIIILDCAQALAHNSALVEKTDADVICFSAHKMYSASLGGIIMKRSLLPLIKTSFLGGGMVDDVDANKFLLSSDNPEHAYTKFEAGLQAWGEIIALGAAIDWLEDRSKKDHQNLDNYATELFNALSSHEKIHLINHDPATTMSFYIDGIDSHLLGAALADQGIMARTGYFCVHYYLDHVLHLPPLVRFSLGYHTRPSDIKKVIKCLEKF